MSKDTMSILATPERSAATSKPGSGMQTSPAEQARGSAEAEQGRIATRAYELYEERGRQEGRDVQDWLDAERQLVRATGKS